MGMMAKMRSLAPWFIITVGGLFVLFMVLSDSQVVNIMGQRSNNIGYVNGEPITYQEFSQYLDVARQQQQAQSGQDIDESQMEVLRDQVWSAYVNQMLINEKIDEFGIVVTDQEVKDEILGPNPPAFLRQSFLDSNGVFNRQAYDAALQNPQNRDALIQAEETVRQQKIQDKLRSYLNGAILVTEAELKRQYQEENTKIFAEYALVQSNSIPDSLISVTDEDVADYYEDHKSDYKVDPTRKLKYVLFERRPSKDDSIAIKNNLEAIVRDLEADTASFRNYVNIYSEQPYSLDTLTVDKIHPDAVSVLNDAAEGEIIGPVLTSGGYTVYKLIDQFRSGDEFAQASHILVRGKTDESKAKIDSIYNALMNGADFAQTAIEVSEDPGSGSRGGQLGWFGKGQMVPAFEEAVFSGRVDQIQKPIETQFGYHIILVTDRTRQQYVVEKIVNSITPSGTTIDRLFENASDYAYLAEENGFESEAELLEYDVVETRAFSENTSFVPGLGQSNALVKFTFENSVGDISEVIRVPTGYVVAKISEANKAGFRPLDEIRDQIERSALREKKLDYAMGIAADIYAKVKDDGTLRNAEEMSPYVKFEFITDFTVKGSIPTVGQDEAFAAYALNGELKKISEPIRGTKGAYLIRVSNRTDFDADGFATEKESLRRSLYQQKRSDIYTEWLAQLRDNAEIVDNRHLFYR